MAKFQFNGGDIVAFGYTFKKGEYTEVTDERVAAKLRGNGEFTQGRAKKKKAAE